MSDLEKLCGILRTVSQDTRQWASHLDQSRMKAHSHIRQLFNVIKQSRRSEGIQALNSLEIARHHVEMASDLLRRVSVDALSWVSMTLASSGGSGKNAGSIPVDGASAGQSAATDAKATNPNYNENDYAYSHNCQRCVPAWEARRRGHDVIAKPKPNPDDLGINWTAMYQNPQPVHCSGNGYNDVVESMKGWGDGARGEVKLFWAGFDGGHVFAAEVVNGEVEFFDPQYAERDCKKYFDKAEIGTIELLRTDNLDFSERINDCVTGGTMA